ncbi:MAG TPA: sulfatase-like hydrolase/transferase [Chlamydiales bacterium]|nr:sulfatase-like hydrolase/transferase [Chlamydiales bacterium]
MTQTAGSKLINYLFYCVSFVFLFGLSAVSLLTQKGFLQTKLFFLACAFGQAFVEIGLFALIGTWLKRKFAPWVYKTFVGFLFLYLLGHFVDFLMLRLMDTSIIYMFKLFFGGGISHFIAAITALNINIGFLAAGFAFLIIFPLIGLLVYEGIKYLGPKKISLSGRALAKSIGIVATGLTALSLAFMPFHQKDCIHQFEKTLPLGTLFFKPSPTIVSLDNKIAPLRDDHEIASSLANREFKAATKPNIFLFVVETFRKDHVTEEIAPNLYQFQKDNLSFPKSFSNGNGTHISWYSIFHSNFPYHISEAKKKNKMGSVPLQILKKMGYKIRVISSAEFTYFQMDDVMFGEKHALLDEFQDLSKLDSDASTRDKEAIKKLGEAMQEKEGKEGNVFIVFLDSTHSEYAWPKDFAAPFTPYAPKIDYLSVAFSKKGLNAIKNRYKNSVHYIDHLFGSFIHQLKENKLFDDAVIAITGDHGEEFFEDGALFHGTHLNSAQTLVPLYYKLGSSHPNVNVPVTSQMDIMPTILHYITKEEDFSEFFEGRSVLSERVRPYVLTVQQNGAETPSTFFLHDGESKLSARFAEKDLYTGKTLELLKTETPNEKKEQDIFSYFKNLLQKK